ncbi:LytR/AlgR family response regulator transcription factor [Gemmatimonas sp. UBA7669]|uniref:LytR/AlgR family response regulator transcription factor n=1 Tax=Gemmatimonas sp. UBA7669 TaxID=1946568 RepID=UPI0025C475A2|nr:LytTR family DNA-binding domain-containing protein [Gemmatimonas sp. UBA7669]
MSLPMSQPMQAPGDDVPSTVSPRWNVLIADDEPLARARLRTLLARHPEFALTAECGSGTAVLAALRDGPADVLLLDIRMPGLDGIATIEALVREAPWAAERPPLVVLVTASEEHAIRAFDLDVVDYLVKPVDIDRFDRAMKRLLDTLATTADTTDRVRAQTPREINAKGTYPKRLVVRDAQGLYFVAVADVDRVEADGNYVAVIAGGRRHLVRESLQLLASRLDPAEFVRIHRSHLVRIDRIRRLTPCGHGEYELTMTDGTRLTSSRSYRDDLRRLLG